MAEEEKTEDQEQTDEPEAQAEEQAPEAEAPAEEQEEAPAEAAARECLEEICAKVTISALLDVYHIVRADGRGMVGIAYVGSLDEGEAPSTGSEMLEVGLFAPDNLPELAFSSHRRAIADWANSRAGTARA